MSQVPDRVMAGKGRGGSAALRVLLVLVGLAGLSARSSSLHAQGVDLPPEDARWAQSTWVDEFNFMAANALINAIVGGVSSALREGGSFQEGFLRGASGGAIVYAGKRLAAERFFGSGFLGREVAAVGTSLTRSIRSGRASFAELVLPVGPLRFYWDREDGHLTVKPDVAALYWLGYGVVESRLELDWRETLSAGTPVFVTTGADLHDGFGGVAVRSVIVLSSETALAPDHVLAHERVHIIQLDNQWGVWDEPLERWALSHFGAMGSAIGSRVDLGLTAGLPYFMADRLWSDAGNPFQVEANFLQMRTRP